MLYFSLTITYNNNLRILQDDVEAKCIKVEPIKEEFNKYNCSVQIKNSNINDIIYRQNLISNQQLLLILFIILL